MSEIRYENNQDAAQSERESLDETARRVAREYKTTEDFLESPVDEEAFAEFSDDLSSFCFLNRGKVEEIRSLSPAGSNPYDALAAGWRAAYEAHAAREYEGKIIFPIPVMRADGETPVEVSIRRSDFTPTAEGDLFPWFICYVNSYVRPQSKEIPPSKAIEKFAWLGSWDTFLDELAEVALEEKWSFDDDDVNDERKNTILKSYICTTFYRLSRENKIAISEDGELAAFNTGLVNKRYDDIYACFEPSDKGIAWQFSGFTTAGAHGLGKQLVSKFNPLPQAATYFSRKEDMLFDLDKDLIVDYDHIIVDNIERLPLEFLEEEMRSNDDALEVIAEIKQGEPGDERAGLFEELSEIVEDDARVFRRTREGIEAAVRLACRRVRWNFKTAIPSYYPRGNSMSLLLPLSLTDEDHVDAALVVQLTPSGNYQGQTILTMRQAYKHARLICRPDSDWLTTAQQFEDDEEDDL